MMSGNPVFFGWLVLFAGFFFCQPLRRSFFRVFSGGQKTGGWSLFLSEKGMQQSENEGGNGGFQPVFPLAYIMGWLRLGNVFCRCGGWFAGGLVIWAFDEETGFV